jgi:peptidoglycan/LPS O-acetylase OafA/YrhL
LPALLFNYFDLSGWDAVNMFMILSGFVIFHLLNKGRESYPAYIIRRFFRLWPVFIVCILLGILTNGYYLDILAQNPWSHNSWIRKQLEITSVIQKNILPYFLFDVPMLHGIVPDFVLAKAGSAFSSLAWCISTEWQFYLCAPLFYRWTKNVIGTLLLTAFVVFSLAYEHVFDFSINPNGSLLPLQLHWFFLGMICYLAYRDVEANGLTPRNRVKIALVVVFALGISIFKPRLAPAACAWLFAFAALIATAQRKTTAISGLVTGVFDHPVSRFFGRMSYPVYLIHWPVCILVITAVMRLLPHSSWSTAYLILMIAVPALTWPLAYLTHRFLEAPGMDLGKRIASRFPRRISAAPAASPGASQPKITVESQI